MDRPGTACCRIMSFFPFTAYKTSKNDTVILCVFFSKIQHVKSIIDQGYALFTKSSIRCNHFISQEIITKIPTTITRRYHHLCSYYTQLQSVKVCAIQDSRKALLFFGLSQTFYCLYIFNIR